MTREASKLELGRTRTRLWLAGVMAVLQAAAFVACGSRTALPWDEVASGPNPSPVEGGQVLPDGRVLPPDPVEDALPPLDVGSRPDVNRTDCPDADFTLIYLVTADNELIAFDPTTFSFRTIARLACPTQPGDTPFSMAVDRRGTAYVLYSRDGGDNQAGAGLYRVSTATGACTSTAFASVEGGDFNLFGMGFATDELGPAETLYVASARGTRSQLARIDTTTFAVSPIGEFDPPIDGAELTGNGAGELFGFYDDDFESHIMLIDKSTAQIVADDQLAGVRQGNAWAFAYWGSDFWLFTAPAGNSSRVSRYRPSDKSLTEVAQFPSRIVGAGVSTCAPQ